jgi:hypothetical protein
MKRLFILALLAFAAWYGWKHYPELLSRTPGHEAVIENDSGLTMERIRLTVDGQTLVKESLATGEKAALPFKVRNDASLKLEWQWKEKLGEMSWAGGMVPRGPMVQRHIMQVDADGGVVYIAENK